MGVGAGRGSKCELGQLKPMCESAGSWRDPAPEKKTVQKRMPTVTGMRPSVPPPKGSELEATGESTQT